MPSLDEDTLAVLTQVLLGLLEIVPEPAKDHPPLNNGLLYHETHWLALVKVKGPVLKLVVVWVQVQKQWLHRHLDLLSAGILHDFSHLVTGGFEGQVQARK